MVGAGAAEAWACEQLEMTETLGIAMVFRKPVRVFAGNVSEPATLEEVLPWEMREVILRIGDSGPLRIP